METFGSSNKTETESFSALKVTKQTFITSKTHENWKKITRKSQQNTQIIQLQYINTILAALMLGLLVARYFLLSLLLSPYKNVVLFQVNS